MLPNLCHVKTSYILSIKISGSEHVCLVRSLYTRNLDTFIMNTKHFHPNCSTILFISFISDIIFAVLYQYIIKNIFIKSELHGLSKIPLPLQNVITNKVSRPGTSFCGYILKTMCMHSNWWHYDAEDTVRRNYWMYNA